MKTKFIKAQKAALPMALANTLNSLVALLTLGQLETNLPEIVALKFGYARI
jgi:hypothetical protein